MGRRGPKPTPTSILKLRGSARARSRANEPELPELDEEPKCPAWFPPVAVRKWTEVIDSLRTMGLLTAADLDQVQFYCVAYAKWIKAEAKLKRGGEVVTHKNGVEGRSHWLRIAGDAMDRMMKIAAEFGFSPAARTRLQVPGSKQPGDKFDGFLNRKGKRKTG